MPIYEYRCGQCGKVSEFLVGVTKDDPDIKCKSCGSTDLKKILSAGFVQAGNSSKCGGCDLGPNCNSSPCCGGKCNH